MNIQVLDADQMDLGARLRNLESITQVPVLLSLLVVSLKSAASRKAPAPLPQNTAELHYAEIKAKLHIKYKVQYQLIEKQ